MKYLIVREDTTTTTGHKRSDVVVVEKPTQVGSPWRDQLFDTKKQAQKILNEILEAHGDPAEWYGILGVQA